MNDYSVTNWPALTDASIERTLGAYIRSKRLDLNQTQKQLAKRAGVSRSTLSLLERGQTVTLLTFIQVLRALDSLYVLDVFLPSSKIRPMDLIKRSKNPRQRASGGDSTNRNDSQEESDW